jgi:polyhydroxyalkanoate synthase subunit PhaC
MAAQETDGTPRSTASDSSTTAQQPGPDLMLGLWTSWMKTHSEGGQDLAGFGSPWWQVSSDDLLGKMLAGGVATLNETLGKDPLLRSVDQMWNANPLREVIPIDWAEIARSLRTVWMRNMSRPAQAATEAAQFGQSVLNTAMQAWNEAGQQWWGLASGDAKAPKKKGGDKRFSAPEWQENPVYRTMRDVYLLASDLLLRQGEALDMDEAEKQRINFHLRQFVDATSPSLLLISNPAALRRAMETGGVSLADGARNLMADLKEGRLSMVDATAFAPGRNMALSPGKVVHRNKLIELIQYEPKTETVYNTPLLIFPPWINKYYILDLQPKNSMMKWLVEQGFTVFIVSWKNPDESMDGITIEDYVDLGPLEASDVVREITGSPRVNTMGYCIGGTLQLLTLAWLAAKGDDERFNSATFMVSLQDYSRVGDTAVFLGEDKLDFVEQQMMQRGYLDSREMSNMFNLLRANDLIWSNVVNNYLMGQKPPAFDLLYWNSDGTRMTRAAHSWYLRNTYAENNLIVPGKVQLKGEALDLGKIKQDVYAVGAEKDHIVPWDAAWRITQLAGGKVRYVLANSGHIAGMINPPGGKGTYWVNEGGQPAASAEEWRKGATAHEGSWWTDWGAWLAERSGQKGKPPTMGSTAHPPLADAPGTYVLEK